MSDNDDDFMCDDDEDYGLVRFAHFTTFEFAPTAYLNTRRRLHGFLFATSILGILGG